MFGLKWYLNKASCLRAEAPTVCKPRCQFQYKCKDKRMFDSITDLAGKLAATGYFIDPVMTQVVFLAAKLQKPLLLEGPAGSGKTQLAVSVAAAARTNIERL